MGKELALESLDVAEKGWHAVYHSYLWRWYERTGNVADVKWIPSRHREPINIRNAVLVTLDRLADVRRHLFPEPIEAPDIVLAARVFDPRDKQEIEKHGAHKGGVSVDGKLLMPVMERVSFDNEFGRWADQELDLLKDRKAEKTPECCRGGTELWDKYAADRFSILRAKIGNTDDPPPADGCYAGNILWRDGVRHDLSPQSWAILNYCWNGEPVDFDEAANKIWGGDTDWPTIHTALSRLRKELSHCRPPIKVSGKGQRIEVSFPPPDVVTDLLRTA